MIPTVAVLFTSEIKASYWDTEGHFSLCVQLKGRKRKEHKKSLKLRNIKYRVKSLTELTALTACIKDVLMKSREGQNAKDKLYKKAVSSYYWMLYETKMFCSTTLLDLSKNRFQYYFLIWFCWTFFKRNLKNKNKWRFYKQKDKRTEAPYLDRQNNCSKTTCSGLTNKQDRCQLSKQYLHLVNAMCTFSYM